MTLPETDPDVRVPPPLASAGTALNVCSAGLTHPGRVRTSNEDHFLVAELARTLFVRHTSLPQAATQYSSQGGHVFIVADGMGGHSAGEVASALSISAIQAFLLNSLQRVFILKGGDEQAVLKEFEAALREADARLFEEAARQPQLQGMGSTLTLAFVVRGKLLVAHAGDSRCYLHRGGSLQQVTHDHTLAAEMVRRGLLSPEEAKNHYQRGVITSVLGGHDPGVHVETHRLDLEPGDVVLLCSDGLSGMVPDERIAEVLRAERDPEEACARLVAEANARGGTDNITVIVARFNAA